MVVFPLLGAFLMACPSPSPVDEIVAANLAARGGKERIEALQSVRMTGIAAASGGRIARVVREVKRPGMFRIEFSSQGATSVFANDGETGWEVAPLQGVFEPRVVSPGADSAGEADQRDIEGPLVNWRSKGNLVELVGREALPGGEAFKLKLTLAGGAVRYDYVDVDSHLIVRSDFTRVIRGHREQLMNLFSDFREVDGLVFPFHIETHVEGSPEVITINLETIELNPEIDDAVFRLPE
jgi:hypothetical protein